MKLVNSQEKQIQINGLNINYKIIGNGKTPVVLLHGWGVSSDKYLELARWLHSPKLSDSETRLWSRDVKHDQSQDVNAKRLHRATTTMEPAIQRDFKILIPDLPGFGKSDEPNENWKLDDYVEFIDEFIKKASRKGGFELVKDLLKKFNPNRGLAPVTTETKPLQKFVLIGHSFGGRIAIKYAVKYPEKIDKLILTGAAGIKHKLTAKQKIFFILAKTGKKIFSLPIVNNLKKYAQKFLYKAAREKDYYEASPRMKEIMKNVLDEDLTGYLNKIKNPTLLVWGREDKTTPLADGEIMNREIQNSKLVVIDDANHSLPYQKPEEFAKIINLTLTNTN